MIPLTAEKINHIWDRFASDAVGIFVCDLLVHEVEAKVKMRIDEPMDELERFVLRATQFADPPVVTKIDDMLHLGRQIVFRLCESFCRRGLLVQANGQYCITEEGNRTLETGRESKTETKFHAFHFIHPSMQFISRRALPKTPLRELPKNEIVFNWKFSAKVLDDAIAQNDAWKHTNGFPVEVQRRLIQEESDGEQEDSRPLSSMRELPVTNIAKSIPVIGVSTKEMSGITRVDLYGNDDNREEPIMCLRDESAVSSTMSNYLAGPSQEEVDEAWRQLCYEQMLERPEDASVTFQDGRLMVEMGVEHLRRCRSFAVKQIHHPIVWRVGCRTTWRLCELQVSGADEAANELLCTLTFLARLSTSTQRASLLKSQALLLDWCRKQPGVAITSIRELANIAFANGDFELALSVSELEDMVDATV